MIYALANLGIASANGTTDVGFDTLRRVVDHRWESFTIQSLGQGTLLLGFEHQDGNATPAPLYDRSDNKLIEFKTHDPGNSEQYKYDSVYRLSSTGNGSQPVDSRGFERGAFTNTNRNSMAGGISFFEDWDLEGLGNWSRLDRNGTVETRTHTDFNEIHQINAGAPVLYDKNGNLTDDGTFTYAWDALNRLRA